MLVGFRERRRGKRGRRGRGGRRRHAFGELIGIRQHARHAMHVSLAHRHALQPLIRVERVQHERHAYTRDGDHVWRKQEGRPREAPRVVGQAPRGFRALRLRTVGEQFQQQSVRVVDGEIAR